MYARSTRIRRLMLAGRAEKAAVTTTTMTVAQRCLITTQLALIITLARRVFSDVYPVIKLDLLSPCRPLISPLFCRRSRFRSHCLFVPPSTPRAPAAAHPFTNPFSITARRGDARQSPNHFHAPLRRRA